MYKKADGGFKQAAGKLKELDLGMTSIDNF